jgi:type II secretion system protein I
MKIQNTQRGFTLVEVLIALTIFSIAVAGVITVSVQGSLNVNTARNKMVANYLADEGVELMRSMRDTAVVNSGIGSEAAIGWPTFTAIFGSGICTGPSHPCDIDVTNYASANPFPNSSNLLDCSSVSATGFCPLYVLPGSGTYTSNTNGLSGVPLSAFSRQIIVIPNGADEMKVTSTVRWYEGTVLKTLTQTEILYNWYV